MLEKILESLLDCKEIKPLNPKENQSWIFIGRTDAEAEAPILWPPDAKNWLTGKDPDAGKDWRQEKRLTEDKMVGWHHWLDGHDSEQALGVGDGQGSLACWSWARRESDMIEWLIWTEGHPRITDSMDMSVSKLQEFVMDREACCAAERGVAESRTRLNWLKLPRGRGMTPPVGWHRIKASLAQPCHQSRHSFPQSLPSGTLHKPLHQRADRRSKKNCSPTMARAKITLQKVNQDEKAKSYVPDEGAR